jgi:deoxyhypusine synthase
MAEDRHPDETPSVAKDAVFKVSESVPDGSKEVQGIDFNKYCDRNITVDELLNGMANMGFQATSVGEAVRIINEMVGQPYCWGATMVPEVDVRRPHFD